MRRTITYRHPLYLLLLLGCLLFSGSVSAQVGDPDRVLRTEKQKKKPKKKKRKDPDHSPRKRVWMLWKPAPKIDHKPGDFSAEGKMKKKQKDSETSDRERVWVLRKPAPQINHKPGDFGAEGALPQNDDFFQPELNGKQNMTKQARNKKQRPKSTSYQGNIKVKKGSVKEPGVHYSERSEKAAKENRSARGTDHQGNIAIKERDVNKPGQVYNQEDRLKASKRKKLPGTNDAGNSTVKTKYMREPGQHWSERKSSFAKQYNSTEAASHPGSIKGRSKREKTRYYGNLSEKVNQHEGNIKISREKQRDMHPSAVARNATSMRSMEQKDKARNRSRWLNRIFKNKQQPKSVKAKDRKPHYDKGESTIWND